MCHRWVAFSILLAAPIFAQPSTIPRPQLNIRLTTRAPYIGCWAISPNGSMMATTGAGNDIRLWDLKTGREKYVVGNNTYGGSALAFSPDGKYLASGASFYQFSPDGEIHLWDIAKRSEVRPIGGYTRRIDLHKYTAIGPVSALAFSPDGATIAAGSDHPLTSDLKLFRVATGDEDPTWKWRIEVTALAYSPDGRSLAVGLTGGGVRLWRIGEKEPYSALKGLAESPTLLRFDHAGSLVIAVGQQQVRLWRLDGAQQILAVAGKDAQFAKDGSRLAVLNGTNIDYYDTASGRVLPAAEARSAEWEAQNRWLVNSDKKQSQLFDVGTGAALDLEGEQIGSGGAETAVFSRDSAVSRKSGMLAIAGGQQIRIFDLANGDVYRSLQGPSQAIAFSPDGRMLAGQNGIVASGNLYLWRLDSPDPVNLGHSMPMQPAVSFNADGSLLVSAGMNSAVSLFTTSPDRFVTEFPSMGPAVAFHPVDGSLLAVADGDGIQIAKAGAGKKSKAERIGGGSGPIGGMAFDPTGRCLFYVAGNAMAFWDLQNRKGFPIAFSRARLTAAAAGFTGRGPIFAAGGEDGVISLISPQVRPISAHPQRVESLSFSPDGHRLVSAGADAVKIWETESGQEVLRILTLPGNRDWLAVTPDGLFDGTPAAMAAISWRADREGPLVPVDTFFSDYYRPGLIAEAMASTPKATVDIATMLQIPGLRMMMSTKPPTATLRQLNGKVVVCLTQPPTSIFPLPGNTAEELGGFIHDPKAEDQRCQYRRILETPGDPEALIQALSLSKPEIPASPWDGQLWTPEDATIRVQTIAIDKYPESSGFLPLRYSVHGAELFRQYFQQAKQSGSRVEILPGLNDGEATRSGILSRLAEVARGSKPQDVVILFFSGHGIVPDDSEMFYFAPTDTKGTSATQRKTNLSAADVADLVRHLPARRVLLIVDSCQSGGALEALGRVAEARIQEGQRRVSFNKSRAQSDALMELMKKYQNGVTPEELAEKMMPESELALKEAERALLDQQKFGIHMIAAATPLQSALQPAEQGLGLFVKVLIQGLKDASNKPVTAVQLGHYVEAKLLEQTKGEQVPMVRSVGADFQVACSGDKK